MKLPTKTTNCAVPALIICGGENTVVVRAYNDLPFGAGGWYGGPIALYSRAAYHQENGGENTRFYEERFKSSYAAKALGMEVFGYDPYLSVENAWTISNHTKRADKHH